MKKEDKMLLLKDLCARLPYGFIVYRYSDNANMRIDSISTFGHFLEYSEGEDFKPYLRPMSSMTEEEKDEIAFIRDRDFQSVRKWLRDELIKETGNIYPITYGEIDFCNKKHLDYRGLIPISLALEASEGMYEY